MLFANTAITQTLKKLILYLFSNVFVNTNLKCFYSIFKSNLNDDIGDSTGDDDDCNEENCPRRRRRRMINFLAKQKKASIKQKIINSYDFPFIQQ